jgi:hypothetical protein
MSLSGPIERHQIVRLTLGQSARLNFHRRLPTAVRREECLAACNNCTGNANTRPFCTADSGTRSHRSPSAYVCRAWARKATLVELAVVLPKICLLSRRFRTLTGSISAGRWFFVTPVKIGHPDTRSQLCARGRTAWSKLYAGQNPAEYATTSPL